MQALIGNNNTYDALLKALGGLWEATVPLKLKTFGWRLFLNKLPSRSQLIHKGIAVVVSITGISLL